MLWEIVVIVGVLLLSMSVKLVFNYSDGDSASFLDYFYIGYHYYEAPLFAFIPFAICILADIFCVIHIVLLQDWTSQNLLPLLFAVVYIVCDIMLNILYLWFSFGRIAEPVGPVRRFLENKKHYEKRAARCYDITLEEFKALEREKESKYKKLKEELG